jgi:hypothetical protein
MEKGPQFIVNERGEKVSVILSIKEYREILEQMEEAEELREFDEAVSSGETPVPYEQAISEIKHSRK